MLTYDQFILPIMEKVATKPKEWRDGQAVFNYTEQLYGSEIARTVQFNWNIDCFYDDGRIEPFLKACYQEYKSQNKE